MCLRRWHLIGLVNRLFVFYFRDTRLILKYVGVGGASAILEYTLFNFLYDHGIGLLIGNSLAIAITVTFHFNAQKHWTFQDSQALTRQLPRYIMMIGVAAGLNNLLVYFLIEVMLLPSALAKLIQICLLFSWTFTVSRLIVFRTSLT